MEREEKTFPDGKTGKVFDSVCAYKKESILFNDIICQRRDLLFRNFLCGFSIGFWSACFGAVHHFYMFSCLAVLHVFGFAGRDLFDAPGLHFPIHSLTGGHAAHHLSGLIPDVILYSPLAVAFSAGAESNGLGAPDFPIGRFPALGVGAGFGFGILHLTGSIPYGKDPDGFPGRCHSLFDAPLRTVFVRLAAIIFGVAAQNGAHGNNGSGDFYELFHVFPLLIVWVV